MRERWGLFPWQQCKNHEPYCEKNKNTNCIEINRNISAKINHQNLQTREIKANSSNKKKQKQAFIFTMQWFVSCRYLEKRQSTRFKTPSIHENSSHNLNCLGNKWHSPLVCSRVMFRAEEKMTCYDEQFFLLCTFSVAAFQFPCSQMQSFHGAFWGTGSVQGRLW